MSLAHYIIVRKDLPLGTLAAMITHAAGESASEYDIDAHCNGWFIGNTIPAFFMGCVAVVLEVKNEAKLLEAEKLLINNGVSYTLVRESSPPWNGAAMAIGLTPVERDEVRELLEPFQTLKTLDPPPTRTAEEQEKIDLVKGIIDSANEAQWKELYRLLDKLEDDTCTCTNCRLDKAGEGV